MAGEVEGLCAHPFGIRGGGEPLEAGWRAAETRLAGKMPDCDKTMAVKPPDSQLNSRLTSGPKGRFMPRGAAPSCR
jgi:hypothetical protein